MASSSSAVEKLHEEVKNLQTEVDLRPPASEYWEHNEHLEERLQQVERGLQTHERALSSSLPPNLQEELLHQRELIAQLHGQLSDSVIAQNAMKDRLAAQEFELQALRGGIGQLTVTVRNQQQSGGPVHTEPPLSG